MQSMNGICKLRYQVIGIEVYEKGNVIFLRDFIVGWLAISDETDGE